MKQSIHARRIVLLANALGLLGTICLSSQVALAQGSPAPAYVGSLSRWNTSQEMSIATVLGQKVAPKDGGPAGLSYRVQSSQGAFIANFGPFLPKADTALLTQGVPVTMIGLKAGQGDDAVFLVREVTVGGRTVTIRSKRGMPVRQQAVRLSSRLSHAQVAGGAQ